MLEWSFHTVFNLRFFRFSCKIAKMFGITLPINFNSPYKSNSIIEFWKRWHITLSTFFKHYVYFPLGGNREGIFRQFLNIFFVMTLAGFWHGASWNFIIWGGLHGIFIFTNHTWRILTRNWFESKKLNIIKVLLTFLCVTVAWAFFRAETINGALNIISGCFPFFNSSIFLEYSEIDYYLPYIYQIKWFILLFIVIWIFPNTNQISIYLESSSFKRGIVSIYKYNSDHSYIYLVIISFFLFIASFPGNQLNQPFIYFQF